MVILINKLHNKLHKLHNPYNNNYNKILHVEDLQNLQGPKIIKLYDKYFEIWEI